MESNDNNMWADDESFDIKRSCGLTNSLIARGLDNLPDNDFMEVLMRLGELHDKNSVESLVSWLTKVLTEIQIQSEK